MDLGQFTVSLAVKDLQASKDFYLKMGFQIIGGDETQNWLILQSGSAVIGIFQGMFEKNILTFHPTSGIRTIQATLKQAGIPLTREAEGEGDGADYITFQDPDGNQFMIDQFPPKEEEAGK